MPVNAVQSPAESTRPRGFVALLGSNLAAGFRAAAGFPVRVGAFRVSADQALVLTLLSVLLLVGLDWLRTDGEPLLSEFGLGRLSGVLLFNLLGLYLLARATGPARRWPLWVVMFAAAAPLYLLVLSVLDWGWEQSLITDDVYTGLLWALLAWTLVVIVRLVGAAGRRGWGQTVGLTVMLLMVAAVPDWLLGEGDIWYQDYADEPTAPRLNIEQIFYAQPGLVEQQLAQLRPQRPGVVDLYFVGFGGYAHQDVFMREVAHVREVSEAHLDTAGRSVSLVNNRNTLERLPIASLSNLRLALNGIAERMDADEDVLLLYLTSHGGRTDAGKHELSVDFWPVELNTITPEDLRAALDEAGIRWRVLVVSACYSGGFVPLLASDDALVMAAAAADRQSFGCSNKNEYTWFGRALFADSLSQMPSFENAFAHADALIKRWEQRDGVAASRPVMQVGEHIRPQLRRLEHRLNELSVPSDTPESQQL